MNFEDYYEQAYAMPRRKEAEAKRLRNILIGYGCFAAVIIIVKIYQSI